jgi:hypothetical protein
MPNNERGKKEGKETLTNPNKLGEECQYCKKSNHQEEKRFCNPNNLKKKLKEKQKVVVNKVEAQQPRQSN